MQLKSFLIINLTFFICSCGLTTARPKLEMSMAQAAFIAAKTAKADEKAPNLFRKSEIYYIKAKSYYRRKYFNKAKEFAILSKEFAEKAEFAAIRAQALGEE